MKGIINMGAKVLAFIGAGAVLHLYRKACLYEGHGHLLDEAVKYFGDEGGTMVVPRNGRIFTVTVNPIEEKS